MNYKLLIITSMIIFSISGMKKKSYNPSTGSCPFKKAIEELSIHCKDHPAILETLKIISRQGSPSLLADDEVLSFVSEVRKEPTSYTTSFDAHNNSLNQLAKDISPLHAQFLYLYKETNPNKRELLLKSFIIFRILYPTDKNIGIIQETPPLGKISNFCTLY